MHIVSAIFMAAGVAIIALSAWMMICNERTYRQRTRLIDMRPKGDDSFWALCDEYDRSLLR